ncbi:oligosaccharide flippase family protein [Marinitoga lauensis]|uniref:oligosaccharide flippase family protein n=1 Tax=Marinitoga lauensis TaxID=2201189 RepID=UPI0010110F67|nr:oligosaccharide flippase family protein [Marinitoga lauensis]
MRIINIIKRLIKDNITVKSGIWYIITDFMLKGMAFITLPIFTRLLSVKEYGLVSIYMVLVGIFAIITGLDLNSSIGTGLYDFKHTKDEFLSSILFLSLINFLFIASGIIFFKKYLSIKLKITEDIIIFSLLSGYFSFIINFFITKLVFEKNYKKKTLLSLLSSLLNIGMSIYILLIIKSYKGKIYGDIFSKFIISSILFLVVLLKGKKILFKKAWKYSMLISVPLIPHHLSGLILSQFDRLAIQKIMGSGKVGLYSYAYTLGMIPLIILGATNLAWFHGFMIKCMKIKEEK